MKALTFTFSILISSQLLFAENSELFFEKHIRPLFVNECLKCHGGDKTRNDFSVTSRQNILMGGHSGPAIVPHKPNESLLIKAIRRGHKNIKAMPPKKALNKDQQNKLAHWIKIGAPWPKHDKANISQVSTKIKMHWAIRKITNPELPKLKKNTQLKSEIDYFIAGQLEKNGMRSSTRADKTTLIRRASFSLTGLPPKPKEVESFIKDNSKNAFEKVINHYLSQDTYGQRWGRYWLDVARYSDTKGDVLDNHDYPYAWTYRDYVFRSFNEDKPFNQFIKEQLAADQLPGKNKQHAALAFLSIGNRFFNNGHEIIDDRIDAVTRGFLGLTVTCARCHDHKSDDISMSDYYGLYGVMHNIIEPKPENYPTLRYDLNPDQVNDYKKQLGVLTKEKDDFITARYQEAMDSRIKYLSGYLHWLVTEMPNHKHLNNPDKTNMTNLHVRFKTLFKQELVDKSPAKDPALTLWTKHKHFTSNNFSEQSKKLIQSITSAKNKNVNPILLTSFQKHPPQNMHDVAALYTKALLHAHQVGQQQKEKTPLVQKQLADLFNTKLFLEKDQNFSNLVNRNKLKNIEGRIAKLNGSHKGASPRAMIVKDRPHIIDAHIFRRGNPGLKGKKVKRGFLRVLQPHTGGKEFKNGSGRLELAEAITHPQNPLTARVIVNRIWKWHFGSGFVDDASNFGWEIPEPTHHKLLDKLSYHFIQEGWSIKKLHRKIMLSHTWQQKSSTNHHTNNDPNNNYYWRMNRQVLDFESMRDSLLASADCLQTSPILGKEKSLLDVRKQSPRSAYLFVDRKSLPSVMTYFDFAAPNFSRAFRAETIVPQQSLFFLNSEFVQQCAIQLSKNIQTKSNHDKVITLYKKLFSRLPSQEEINLGLAFINEQKHMPHRTIIRGWQYGYGSFDTKTNKTIGFKHFKHFKSGRWQSNVQFPDKEYGHVSWTKLGGHPGKGQKKMAIKRWTAPQEGLYRITGTLKHPSELGDGIEAYITTSNLDICGSWNIKKKQVSTHTKPVLLKRGDYLDFIVNAKTNPNGDTFHWNKKVELIEKSNNNQVMVLRSWSSLKMFNSTQNKESPLLTPWQRYIQVLYQTNEFLYID